MSIRIKDILEKHAEWLASDGNGGVKANLEGANLRYANLEGANLRYANLMDADLRYANLWGANLGCAGGNLTHIKSVFCEQYPVTYTADVMQIGCENHMISEWWEFDDRQILKMDGKAALKWWRKWKPILQQIIAASPAEPTRGDI